MFKIDAKSEFTLKGKMGDSNVSFTFLRKTVESQDEFLNNVKDPSKLTKAEQVSYFYYKQRSALIDWTGIADSDGKKLPATDENGVIIEAYQKAVFEAIFNDKKMWEKLQTAINGLSVKN